MEKKNRQTPEDSTELNNDAKIAKQTKISKVLEHLESGKTITPIEALDEYGSFRLSDIILKLRRRGYDIRTDMVKYRPTQSRFAMYTLNKSNRNG